MKVSDAIVDRFLSWRLPDDFSPDCGVSFVKPNHPTSWPVGTNLLTATQAREMLEHVLRTDEQAPVEQPALQLSVNDPSMIKCHVNACITSLRDEDGRTKSRELALAVTNLQDATMWIDEHLRLS